MTPTDAAGARGDGELRAALAAGTLAEPQRWLGLHPGPGDGWRVRTWHPEARAAECVLRDGHAVPLQSIGPAGCFEATIPSFLRTRGRTYSGGNPRL